MKKRDIDIAYYTPAVCRLEAEIANKKLKLERQAQAHNLEVTGPLKAKVADLQDKLESKSSHNEELQNVIKTQLKQLAAAEERCLQLDTALVDRQQQLDTANAALEQERIRTARLKMIHDSKKGEAKRFKKAKAAIRAQRMEELRFT